MMLGKAVGQVSDDTKRAHPELDWAAPVRLRDRIVHGYWSIDVDVLIATAQGDLPSLLAAVRAIELIPPHPTDY
jgi:uncharacterized protein with HEPN domain